MRGDVAGAGLLGHGVLSVEKTPGVTDTLWASRGHLITAVIGSHIADPACHRLRVVWLRADWAPWDVRPRLPDANHSRRSGCR